MVGAMTIRGITRLPQSFFPEAYYEIATKFSAGKLFAKTEPGVQTFRKDEAGGLRDCYKVFFPEAYYEIATKFSTVIFSIQSFLLENFSQRRNRGVQTFANFSQRRNRGVQTFCKDERRKGRLNVQLTCKFFR